MNLAIRNIDRLAAIESGRAAIVEMNRSSVSSPVLPDLRAAGDIRSDNAAAKTVPNEAAPSKSERRTKRRHSTSTMRKTSARN